MRNTKRGKFWQLADMVRAKRIGTQKGENSNLQDPSRLNQPGRLYPSLTLDRSDPSPSSQPQSSINHPILDT
jgi:hypothetical protein